MSTINLHNVDCMEFLRGLPDKHYSLAIVDPPYKDDVSGLGQGHNRSGFQYTHFAAPTKEYISELFRVSGNQILWGFNYYMDLLPRTDACIFWNKHQNGGFADGELAWVSTGKTRYFDRAYQIDIGNKIHPTQKPVALYRWLLQNYAKPGDTILDTHGGSMSIAIACDIEGFDLDLCELDKDYFEAGKKRLEVHRSQPRMFTPEPIPVNVQTSIEDAE